MSGFLKTDTNTTRLSHSLANPRDGEFPSKTRPTLQWVTSVQRAIKATLSTSSVIHSRLAWSSNMPYVLYFAIVIFRPAFHQSNTSDSWHDQQILNKIRYITPGWVWQSEKPQNKSILLYEFHLAEPSSSLSFTQYINTPYSGSLKKKKLRKKNRPWSWCKPQGHTFSRQHRHCYLLFTQLINKHFRWAERVSGKRLRHVGRQPPFVAGIESMLLYRKHQHRC